MYNLSVIFQKHVAKYIANLDTDFVLLMYYTRGKKETQVLNVSPFSMPLLADGF